MCQLSYNTQMLDTDLIGGVCTDCMHVLIVGMHSQAQGSHLICVNLDNDFHQGLLVSSRQGVLHGLELADKDVDVACEASLGLLLC